MVKTSKRHLMYSSNERGIALITTLLVMMLMSALLVGFTAVVMSDQRYRFIDRDRGQAFYAAAGGIEKLTADLGNLFFSNVAPTAAPGDRADGPTKMPAIAGVTFAARPGGAGAADELADDQVRQLHGQCATVRPSRASAPTATRSSSAPTPAGNPMPPTSTADQDRPVRRADRAADAVSDGRDGRRRTAAAKCTWCARWSRWRFPVFQFGMFSDVDLSFFAGPNFDFGGRVHTNGNLFLAAGQRRHADAHRTR